MRTAWRPGYRRELVLFTGYDNAKNGEIAVHIQFGQFGIAQDLDELAPLHGAQGYGGDVGEILIHGSEGLVEVIDPDAEEAILRQEP